MPDTNRRSYGTGSLYARSDARGAESWYGRWYDVAGQRSSDELAESAKPAAATA
jgi:hypothetical protein